MPLSFVSAGEAAVVRRVGGSPQVRKHLENLGFVPGSPVSVVSALGGDIIVQVKEARVAISREMAQRILI